MPKQLINIGGVLVTVIILALGIMLGALPLFSESQSTDAEAKQVKQSNDVFEIQVQALRAQEANIEELDAELAELRAMIPTNEFNDQVFEIIVSAAAATGSQIVSASASDYAAWTPPLRADGTSPQADAAAVAAQAAPDEAATNDTDAEAAPAPTPVTAPVDEARVSVPFQLSVVTTSPASAMAFLDLVNAGTRLISIDTVNFAVTTPAVATPGEGEAPPAPLANTQLTVTMHSLVYTGK